MLKDKIKQKRKCVIDKLWKGKKRIVKQIIGSRRKKFRIEQKRTTVRRVGLHSRNSQHATLGMGKNYRLYERHSPPSSGSRIDWLRVNMKG